MKTISDYTIYCTSEQTQKAIELGVPIDHSSSQFDDDCTDNIELLSNGLYAIIPTAEQMIGFFRSKNIHIVIHKDVIDKWSVYGHEIVPIEFTIFDRLTGYNSFEEATIAAIDAALEYLKTNQTK